MLTQTAEQSCIDIPVSFSISLMNTAVSDACVLGRSLSLYEMIFPPDAIAAEHSSVEVSMSMMLSIIRFVIVVRTMKEKA